MGERQHGADPDPVPGGDADPIPGLEVLTPRLRALLATLLVLLLAAVLAVAFVPRTLDEGRAILGTEWTVTAAPRALTPAFTVTAEDAAVTIAGTRWPGRLQAEQVRLGPEAVAVVGSVPPDTRSVRLTTDAGSVHESRVSSLAWHQVHRVVLDGPVTVVEVVAIGPSGQVLAVEDDLPVARELSAR
ncbi:MAG: hypothetical protein ACLFUG_06905 [Nitriliruptoraceae bacterium]